MNDAFGRRINEGDVIVHSKRTGSSLFMSVGRVIKAEDERIRVKVLAGTDYHWRYGKGQWNEATKTYEHLPHEGHEAWIRASGNVVVANGIDALGIHDRVLSEQRNHLAKIAKK